MKRITLALLLIMLPAPAFATYPVGYVYGSYTYDGQFWINGGNAYSWTDPVWVAPAYTRYNGCTYCTSAGYWKPGYYTLVKAYTATANPGYQGLDRTAFLQNVGGIVKQQITQEYQASVRASDAKFVLDTYRALGIGRPLGEVPYGSNYYRPGIYGGSYSVGGYGVVPNQTIYASSSSLKQVVTAQGNPAIDLNAITQTLAQSNAQVLSNGDKQLSRAAEIFKGVLADNADIERLKSDYQGKLALLDRTLNGTPSVSITTTATKTTPTVPVQAPDPKATGNNQMPRIDDGALVIDAARLARLETIASASCVKCHDDAKPSGNFKIKDLTTSKENMLRAFNYVRPDAPDNKRCPKSDKPLTWDQALDFRP